MASVFEGIGSLLFGTSQTPPASTTVVNTPPPAPPVQSPSGTQTQYAPGAGQPSFLASAATAAPSGGSMAGKTLLGQ